jgi:hypothetical protein
VIHQKFREEVANNITIADQLLECSQLANKGFTGEVKIVEEALNKIAINPEFIRSLLRNYICVFSLIIRDAKIKGAEKSEKEESK